MNAVLASDGKPHLCFTVDSTRYISNLDYEDRWRRCVAVHYQRPPEKTDQGRSIGLRVPCLIVSLYMEQPDEVAQRVADILNKHWDDEPADAGQAVPA